MSRIELIGISGQSLSRLNSGRYCVAAQPLSFSKRHRPLVNGLKCPIDRYRPGGRDDP